MIHPRSIAVDNDLRERVTHALETALEPIHNTPDWVDVYLTDVNGPRGGVDKRCRIVAHMPAGRLVVVSRIAHDPVVATAAAAASCRRLIRARRKVRLSRRRRTALV